MPVRLIALDIDGTLLDDRSQLPESNRRAVADAAARGIEIALVTGRRYDFAMPIARQFPCPLTMIVNNGALAKSSGGETQLVRLLPRDRRRARSGCDLRISRNVLGLLPSAAREAAYF